MEAIRLSLTPKQHASLRKGRKCRICARHMQGSGVQYMVRPETLGRLSHSLSLNKGIDLALDPLKFRHRLWNEYQSPLRP